MKRTITFIFLVFVAAGIAACDLLDPTNAENPNVQEADFLRLSNSMALWLQGLERQMTLALNNQSNDLESGYITAAEIASDNYINTRTFFNQFMDQLTFDFTDQSIRITLAEFSDLRETAEFGLSTVAASDTSTTPAQEAELWFFKGMAHLMTGEVYHLAPADSAGPAVPSADQFAMAADAFDNAIALATDPDALAGYHIAAARTHRNLGDPVAARTHAEAALAGNPSIVRFAQHDFTNGPENDLQEALFDRGTFDDLQPLPRLDFLDPKYFNVAEPNLEGDDEDADVAYIKAEEAYLIVAEVQLAGSDLAGAQATLRDLLALVAARPTEELVDSDEGRTHLAPGSRPNTPDWAVAASPDDPMRDGLVVSRTAPIQVPVISGTSVTEADIDALADLDEALELLYLLRQQIFIAEGRRMVDLGIKWPVPEREMLINPNIPEGDPATIAVVPDFLPASEMDAFTMDEAAREVTIAHNLNRVLVQNKASQWVLPFH